MTSPHAIVNDTWNCDVAVIGGGVLGCFAARELAAYGLDTVLLEQQAELCMGVTKANTAIIYSGAYSKPDTLKARLCTQASETFDALCDELGVRFKRCGSLMACFGPHGLEKLNRYLEFGRRNGVKGLRIMSGQEARAMEPGLSENTHAALFDPNVGTVLPWELGLATAKSAADRGVRFCRGTQVYDIKHKIDDGGYMLSLRSTPDIPDSIRDILDSPQTETTLHARAIVNCAGLYADTVLAMLAAPKVRIVPEKGTYYVLDTKAAHHLEHIVFFEPEEKQKGLTLVPTIGGNILVGPSKENAASKDDVATTLKSFSWLDSQVEQCMPNLPLSHTIRAFAAIRPNPYWIRRDEKTQETVVEQESINDFIIERHDEHPGVVSLIGIKTPGLTCAHELGRLAAQEIADYLHATYQPLVHHHDHTKDDDGDENGRILCRCRSITEGKILEVLRFSPRPVTLDGLKRLTECGMGRCQGSFCTQRILEIMQQELAIPIEAILKDVPGSQIVRQKKTPDRPCPSIAAPRCRQPETCNVAIVGGGAAGMTAALELARKGVKDIVVVDREPTLGGVLNQCVHDGFGTAVFGENITGTEYAARLRAHVEQSEGAIRQLCDTTVLSIDEVATSLQDSRDNATTAHALLTLGNAENAHSTLYADKVVLATGCRERPAASLPLAGRRPAGIISAGALQKMLNCGGYTLGTRAIILGSGDVGLIVARRLKLNGCDVAGVVEIKDRCGGRPFNKQRCLDAHGIPLICNATITEVFGTERVNGVTVLDTVTRDERHVDCDLLVSSLGLVPERELVEKWNGKLPPWLSTCGNADHVYDLVDTLVEDTCSQMRNW